MKRLLAGIKNVIRDYAGFLSALFLIIATYLAFHLALLQPEKRLVPSWLLNFLVICGLALLTSFIQQRLANAQAKAIEEENKHHTSLLEQIAAAVGTTQAEAAQSAAETNRKVLQLELQISKSAKPVIVIRMSVDGDKNPAATPTVENIGKSSATNIKIEDINVPGNHGHGEFSEVQALRPGESRAVEFDAPDEGLMFRGDFVAYLNRGLENLPPFDWSKVTTQEDARDLFAPMKMPLNVIYRDPATDKRYRSEHELEFTFAKHVTVIFRRQLEIAA